MLYPSGECATVSDAKVRDILSELQPRPSLGAGLTERVGRRGWERPRVSISPRLYQQYRLGDPWDPGAGREGQPIGLGPVSLRLGEKRRQPAPHLKPKGHKQKKKAQAAPAQFRPRVPDAKPTKPKAAPKPSAEQLQTQRLAALAAQKRAEAEAARSWPRRSSAAAAAPETLAPKKSDGPALAKLPVRPEARAAAAASQPVSEAASGRQDKGGRLRMKSAPTSSAPVIRDIAPVADAPKPQEEPSAPRAAPTGLIRGGLDDLFAAAAQAGRMRVPKRAPAPSVDSGLESSDEE